MSKWAPDAGNRWARTLTALRDDGLTHIQRLRLAIARAGQRDSLSWWDDEALTPGADLLLHRLFPRSAACVAQKLALLAARARHEVVLAEWPQAHHLFDLGEEVESRLDEVRQAVDVPRDPIRSRHELATVLSAIAPEPDELPVLRPESDRAARAGDDVASLSVVDQAVVLAWAYTKPDAAGLVVPFSLPASGGM